MTQWRVGRHIPTLTFLVACVTGILSGCIVAPGYVAPGPVFYAAPPAVYVAPGPVFVYGRGWRRW